MKKIYLQLAAAAAMSCAGFAHATTYTNVGLPDDYSFTMYAFWSADPFAVGNTLGGVDGMLNDYSLYAVGGQSGDVRMQIATWNSQTEQTGSVLYTSAPISYSGGAQALTAQNINLHLAGNQQYLIYLTNQNVAQPVSMLKLTAIGDEGFGNSPSVFGYVQPYNDGYWQSFFASAAYTANVSAPVPEPTTYAMLLAGLAVAGVAARRKARPAA